MADPECPPPLGWPWDALIGAAMRFDAARNRLHAARVMAGTRAPDGGEAPGAAREREAARRSIPAAELELDDARGAFRAVREEMANQWLAGLRAALDVFGPTHLAELLDLPPPRTVVEAIQELEDRVDAAEDAVVELEHGRVVRR